MYLLNSSSRSEEERSQYIAQPLLSLANKDPTLHPLGTKDMEMGAPHSRSGLNFLRGMEPRSFSQQPNEYRFWLYYSGSRFLAG